MEMPVGATVTREPEGAIPCRRVPAFGMNSSRALTARIAAHASWAATPDRKARTAPARTALGSRRSLLRVGHRPATAAARRLALPC